MPRTPISSAPSAADHVAVREDGPLEPQVERVEMPDGRYILYFSWPDGRAVPETPTDAEADPDE